MMTENDNLSVMPRQSAIDAEAADWLLRFEEGDLGAEDVAAFFAWRSASIRHREAFERLAALWGDFDCAQVLSDIAVSDENKALLAKDSTAAMLGPLGRRSVLAGIAASAAGVAGIGIALELSNSPFSRHQHTYRTVIGERRTVELPDGSRIELNTNSWMTYAYSKDAREIQLLQGEAFFDVAPDKERPFSVSTPSGRVTAIGTAFTVRLNAQKVDVLVTEGKVVLRPKKEFLAQPASITLEAKFVTELRAGQNAVFEDDVEQVQSVEPEAMARKLAWRQGVLAFSGDPLWRVIDDVSRYTDVSIEVDDDAVRNTPVSGYFRIGEVEEMFEALEIMAGLEAQQISAKRVRLVRNDDGA